MSGHLKSSLASGRGTFGPTGLVNSACVLGCVFIREEFGLNAGFPAARTKLSRLARTDHLTEVSGCAYKSGLVGLSCTGQADADQRRPKLVRVFVRELVAREQSAVLTMRWQVTMPGGGLFPALDADITLTPAGEGRSLLTLDGAYRPPSGTRAAGYDSAVLHRAATTTIHSLLGQIADLMAGGQES
jgi:hypothetical protein